MSNASRLGLLGDRDFGRFFAATALGQLGDRIIFLALPLVAVVALNADEFQVGLLAAMTTAGSLLVGLPAGAWVDRIRKRPVMISTDLARALILMTIPVAWWAGLLTIRWLYAVALLHGVLTVFFDVAYVSYLPHLVGRGNLVDGNSRLSAIRSVTSISGPTVAGPLVGMVGAPATLLVSSAGMAVSGLLAITIRKRSCRRSARRAACPWKRPGLINSQPPWVNGLLGRMSATTRFVSWGGIPVGGLLGGAAMTPTTPSRATYGGVDGVAGSASGAGVRAGAVAVGASGPVTGGVDTTVGVRPSPVPPVSAPPQSRTTSAGVGRRAGSFSRQRATTRRTDSGLAAVLVAVLLPSSKKPPKNKHPYPVVAATAIFAKGTSGIAFSRDGRTLATGGEAGKVRLWDVATRKVRATLIEKDWAGEPMRVLNVRFSADGKTLATRTYSNLIGV
ncbi:MFS transporter [Streptomyces sp. Wh19]|uniref:MFS transporter n=1 Tax=Streptomyces sp. Wh19 TaxID=3076629 RepID=UPI002958B8F9|nr:MFS transporter [Streptomyces sp. Wh19]MDV9196503.1 MFS transporter [Streptomyces sp. Wh19]